MTDDPAARDNRSSSAAKKLGETRSRRRRWPWVILGLVAVLALIVVFSPTLFGGWLLARYGADLGLSAQRVSGPIWSPRLEGVSLQRPGVDAQAEAAGVTLEAFNPFARTLRLGAGVQNATVNLKVQELLDSLKNAANRGAGSGWIITPGTLAVEKMRVNVDGKKAEIPGGEFQLQKRPDGNLSVQGRTRDGTLSAEIALGENNVITADLAADARVLNFYWPGVTAGRIAGRYVLNDGPLRGNLKITDAALRVPEAKFAEVTAVDGTVTQRGDQIDLKLAGQSWNGPVTATGQVDLKARNWTVTAAASPTVSGLAQALGTTGEGRLNLRVTAGGWQTVQVSARASGGGKVAGIVFSNVQASYAFMRAAGEKAPQNNDLTFSVDTQLGESPQTLSGNWAIGQAGEAQLLGSFGQKPLDVRASIDAQNLVTLSGQGLGGPLSGTFNLKGNRLNAMLSPTYGAAEAKIALSGTPDDLRATVTDGVAGPFALAGTATLNKQGLKADLGTAQLDLNREFRGSWRVQNLKGAGLTLSGGGQLDLIGGDVTGRLSAQVPGVVQTLEGPLDVNYLRQRGTFTSGAQQLRWNGDSFPITARNLEVLGGLKVSGDVTVTNTLKAFGNLTARGNGFDLSAQASGNRASLRGTANGMTVLADTTLSAPYDTTVRLQGADIQGNLSLNPAGSVRFELTTAGQTARGVIDGQNIDASGHVNLAALRPLVGLPDLSGTLDLDLAGRGGTGNVNASVAGADITGTLTRRDGPVTVELRADYAGAVARLNGQVYPQVGVSGTVMAQGQTLRVAVGGPYNALQARATGRTGELSFSGVTLPRQAVDLAGTLTPSLAVNGTWGDLKVVYDGGTGLARVTGTQPLTAFGQAGRVQGRATWGPGQNGTFRGAVDASGTLDQYTVALSGPWSNLNVVLTDREGLSARGTASLPEGRYDVNVRGPLAGGLFIEGNVQGRGTEPRGRINVRDRQGGVATLELRGFSDFDLQTRGLTLAGQPLVGDLQARGGVLSGTLQAGPLRVNAQNGRISAAGEIAGQQISATGRLTLPATLEDLKVNLSGPYFTATASGGVADLRGTLRLRAQMFGSAPLTLSVPAQTFPLTASLTAARVTVGGLTYVGGQWRGSLQARYALSGTSGAVKLLGAGQTLSAIPFGPLSGRLEVLPRVGGTLTASLSPILPLLPQVLWAEVTPGNLSAEVTPTGAVLTTRGGRYLGEALELKTRVNWQGRLSANGTLSAVGSRLPFSYDGQNLSVRGAVLDARALRPVLRGQLTGLSGRATLDLSVPGLDFAQAAGRARVDLRAAGQRASGSVTLARGQLSADLNSTLAGLNVRVRGPLYPQADAALTLDGLNATLRGSADRTLTLRATGQYQQRAVKLTVTGTRLTGGNAQNGRISAAGEIAGQQISATGRLTLPATLEDLKVNLSGPYFTATASGGVADLRGTLRLRAQMFGSAPLTLSVPAQTFPLTASLTAARVTVGGLTYVGGQWRGSLQARYALSGTSGAVKLLGAGQTLSAIPFGPLSGRLEVLPRVGGTLTASLSPILPLLPQVLWAEVTPGNLSAEVTPTGAVLTTRGGRYLGEALELKTRVNWQGRLSANGTLSAVGSRLPFSYDGQNLSVRGAVLDARALRPVLRGQLTGLSGRATLDLSVPGLDFAQAAGRARVDLRAAGQRASGSVTLARGQLSADLNSTLAGLNVRVRGPLYPQADAALTLDGLNATLRGSADRTLTLRATGQYQQRAVKLTVTGTQLTGGTASIQLSGSVADAALNLAVNQGAGAGLSAWNVAGSVSVPDLRPLLRSDTAGNLTAMVDGTLADLRLNVTGSAAGVKFQAPASYTGGVLRLRGATATLPQGRVRVSGPAFPALNLSAKASVTDVLPGQYTAQITGAYSKPDINVQGQLTGGVTGLQAAGTRLTARLLGQDWKVALSGDRLAGLVRGQLGTNALGGLSNAALTVHAAYLGGGPDAPIKVRLDGTPGWNARTGWAGTLRAVGDVPGGPLDAVLDGNGILKVAALVGTGQTQARLTGTLPADLAFKPGGTLNLLAFDVGALWGRPDQLRVSGTVRVDGQTWSAPEAALTGTLEDSGGELSGDLGAAYRAGNLSVRVDGPQVSGSGTLESERYTARLKAGTLRLARLLPRGLDVDALTFAGRVEAAGTLADGPGLVALENVALKGQQEQAGPFSLYGNASYRWKAGGTDELRADLSGSLRGGVLKAEGRLPSGVRMTVRDLSTAFLNNAALNGTVGADVTLRGAVADPTLEGNVTGRTRTVDALATLSGRVRDPRAVARVTVLDDGGRGTAAGTLYADLRGVDLQAGTVRTKLYGTVQSGGNTARVDLNGVWPRLAGTVQATLAGLKGPVTLKADGRGGYALDGGELGGGDLTLSGGPGFVPRLTGRLKLTPLPLLGGTGQLDLTATLAGRLNAPTLAATVVSRKASAYGVTLADTSGRLGGTLGDLTGTLSQGGQTVATLAGSAATLSGLKLAAAGSTVRVNGTAVLNGDIDLDLTSSGTLSGSLKATARARSLSLAGTLAGPQQLVAAVDVRADPFTGWRGDVRVSGGPSLGSSGRVMTAPAILSVSGPLAYPLVQGEAGLLGAQARIVAAQTGVQVRLVDGPGASANGAVGVRPDSAGQWRWNGAASLTRPELSLSVTPSGPLADPQVLLSVRRGEWRASGTATLNGADLRVSDGQKDGTLSYDGQRLITDLPGLQLARLGIPNLNGLLTASGTLDPTAQNGQVALGITDFTSPFEVPYLGLQLSGDASANLTLRGGRPSVTARVTLPTGTLNLNAAQLVTAQGDRNWTGRLSGSLSQQGGVLNVNVGLDGAGLTGLLGIQNYPVEVGGQQLTLGGRVDLQGQTFVAALNARNMVGGASADASGGIADVLPQGLPLSALGLRPTDEGYSVRAVLNELEVSNLKLAPNLSGRISGDANVQEGGGTFVLRSAGLRVGTKTLPARLEGTLAGGSWRIRGFLGESDFTAGLSGGEVFGQGSLRALPVGALVAAFAGTTPGEGVVTGVARFRFPLNEPLMGSVSLVAERIRVSATSGEGNAASTETLTGTGILDYAAGELRDVNIQLSGAGTWDVRGQYTRQSVNLSARFTNTTFTPVLLLIPGLSDLTPSLRGSLTLSADGSYDRPRGLLRVQNVSGSVAGLDLEIPSFTGDLPGSGAFAAGGTILTGGALGANGKLEIGGQLTLGKLSGTRVSFSGLLAPQGLGALPNSAVVLAQNGETWTVDAQSRSVNAATGAGTLRLAGQIAPRIDLSLTTRNYNLPLSVIFARESALNADLRVVDDGTLIRVSGAADFARLILGRADASAAVPTLGRANGQPLGDPDQNRATGRSTDNYASPLPELYTTFPAPVGGGEAAPRPARPFLERVVFEDIPIRASGGIRVDESLARAEFSTAGLTLEGHGAQPRISGSIRSERGLIYLRENEFALGNSSVIFDGSSLLPAFDITAAGQVQAVTTRQRVPVTVNLRGEFVTRTDGQAALNLNTTLSCTSEGAACTDPDTGQGYTEPELYALVATGVPTLTALPGNLGALGASALQTALNVFVLGELERTLAKAFGLDVFRLTPNLTGAEGTVGATLTLGSYLTRDLYLQYQVDLAGQGLLDATYSTPDDRFTFRVSTPLNGLDLGSLRPSFSAGYNINPRTNLSIGVQNGEASTKLRFGVTYRIGGR